MDDIFDNPSKYGMPTFEEFKKNYEFWTGRPDEKFSQVDKGSQHLAKYVKKHLFEIEGHRCKTLEDVEKVALDHGIPIKDLDYTAEIMPLGGGKCDILVKFISKADRERRKNW